MSALLLGAAIFALLLWASKVVEPSPGPQVVQDGVIILVMLVFDNRRSRWCAVMLGAGPVSRDMSRTASALICIWPGRPLSGAMSTGLSMLLSSSLLRVPDADLMRLHPSAGLDQPVTGPQHQGPRPPSHSWPPCQPAAPLGSSHVNPGKDSRLFNRLQRQSIRGPDKYRKPET